MPMYYIAAYISSKKDNHKNTKITKNDFNYIKEYYNSILENKVKSVILIDEGNSEFIKKHTTDNISIIKCDINDLFKTNINKRFTTALNIDYIQPHDIRFYEYYKYISSNKQVKYVALTDISDVIIIKDCSKFLEKRRQNILYICKENELINENIWFEEYLIHIKKKYNIKYLNCDVFKGKVILNAGIICGERDIILNFLYKIINLMTKIYISGNNKYINRPLDMFLVNFIAYTYFSNKLDRSGRLHTKFGHYEYDDSKYFMHK